MEDQKNSRKAAGEMFEATRASYRTVVDRTFAARESNARITKSFFEDTVEALHEETESNLRTIEELTAQVRQQRETLRKLSQQSAGAYREFLDSLTGYYEDSTED